MSRQKFKTNTNQVLKQQSNIKHLYFSDSFLTTPEKDYDEITSLATLITNCPISLITLIGETKQYFKSRKGIDISESTLEHSYCKEIIESGKALTKTSDVRPYNSIGNNNNENPFKQMEFYAGYPIYDDQGRTLASLCVMAYDFRELGPEQEKALKALANQVGRLLMLHKTSLKHKNRFDLLQTENFKIQKIMEHGQISTWEFNPHRGSLKLDGSWLHIIGPGGIISDTITLRDWFHNIHPKDLALVKKEIKACANDSSRVLNITYRMLQQKGSWRWFNCVGNYNKTQNKSLSFNWIGTLFDITERTVNDQELSTRNTFIETLIENSPIGLATYNMISGNTYFMNDTLTNIAGWDIFDLPNRDDFYKKLFPDPNYRQEMMDQFKSGIASENLNNNAWENVKISCKNGSQRLVNIKIIPIPHQELMVSYIYDVTEKNNYIEDIETQNRQLKQINWVQSHEVRAPLARLMGIIDMIQEFGENTDDDLNFLFKEALNSTEELDAIIKKITDLAVKQ